MKKWMLSLFVSLLFLNAKAQVDDDILGAIGGLSATVIYNEYFVIGLLADSYAKDVYSGEKTISLLDEQTDLLGVNREQLADLYNGSALSGNDKLYVREVDTAMKHLVNTANSLKDYIENSDDLSLMSYEVNRDLAWKQIAYLLQLEK